MHKNKIYTCSEFGKRAKDKQQNSHILLIY